MIKQKNEVSCFKTEYGKKEIRRRYEEFLMQWPVAHQRKYIGDTHVIISGDSSAPPLFLLHGSLSNSAAWMGDVKAWSRCFRVIAADIPGQPGLSSDTLLSPAGSGYEDWFESLANDLGYGSKTVSIVGQSLGSFVALRFAVKHPDRVGKISMLTTPAVASAKHGFLFKAMFLMMFGKRGGNMINRMVAYGVNIDKWSSAFGPLLSKYCRPMTEPIPLLSDEQLGRLVMPLQLFVGDHDVMLRSEETAERLGRFAPLAEINLLPGIGHTIIGQTEKIMKFMTEGEKIPEGE